MCYECLACESKMAFIFNSGQLSGLPTELPTISLLESCGLPTELPTELPTFSLLEVVGCPLFPYMEVVGSLICLAKFPWAALSAAH